LPTARLRWNVAGSHRDDGSWAWVSWPGARNTGNLPATVKSGRAALSRGWGEAALAGREPGPDPSPAVPEQPAAAATAATAAASAHRPRPLLRSSPLRLSRPGPVGRPTHPPLCRPLLRPQPLIRRLPSAPPNPLTRADSAIR
jgi:hypothetical protein